MGEGQALIETCKADIQRLLGILRGGVERKDLSNASKIQTLESLKSRITSAEAAGVFTQDDVRTLCKIAFEKPSHDGSSAVALKCIANLLLLEPKTRQYYVDEGYAATSARKLGDTPEDELLHSRILFLLTYGTSFNFEDLFQKESLCSRIRENITAHVSRYAKQRGRLQQPKSTNTDGLSIPQSGALTESLKLLFNLNQFYPSHVNDFSGTITPILKILTSIDIPKPVLQQPITSLINSLLSLDLPGPVSSNPQDSRECTPLFPESPFKNCQCLINILDAGIRSSKDEDLDNLVPLVTLLRRVYELAPSEVKTDMQAELLPSNEERTQPLGKSDSLASRLLRLSTAPTVPRLKEGISSFLFELSDKDTGTFVRNVGYGFAAGYLMTHNLPVPRNAGGDPHDNVTTVDGQEINPITGQRRDMEPEDPLPAMTDEEKEREAERLFVLFERLKATGVMNVVNPVEQATNEGRFEEIE